jgi:hypothetical protein
LTKKIGGALIMGAPPFASTARAERNLLIEVANAAPAAATCGGFLFLRH